METEIDFKGKEQEVISRALGDSVRLDVNELDDEEPIDVLDDEVESSDNEIDDQHQIDDIEIDPEADGNRDDHDHDEHPGPESLDSGPQKTDAEAGSSKSGPSSKGERILQIPISKIKSIIKTDPDVIMCSTDATFLITKATELFIRMMAEEACRGTTSSKKKTVRKCDVDDVINGMDPLAFLDGIPV